MTALKKVNNFFLFAVLLWGTVSFMYPTVRAATGMVTQNIDSLMRTLSLEEKVGQMFMPVIEGMGSLDYIKNNEKVLEMIRSQKVGGFVILRSTPASIRKHYDRLQGESNLPLLFSADLENGPSMRIDGGTQYPSNMGLGAVNDSAAVVRMGELTGYEAKSLGLPYIFAPISDVNRNADNPVINTRAYGDSPALVSRLSVAYMNGLQNAGCIATAKHFPGHGDTKEDSHNELAHATYNPKTEDDDILPFISAIEAGIGSVMTGHLAVRDQKGKLIPATLSQRIVTNLLRKDLGFGGLVVTDAMGMGAITKAYSQGEAGVLAVLAGCDILLFPDNVDAMYSGVLDAVRSGRIPISRINESVKKILEAKRQTGLFENRYLPVENSIFTTSMQQESLELSRSLAARSITVLLNAKNTLPLSKDATYSHLVITSGRSERIADEFIIELDKRLKKVEHLIIRANSKKKDYTGAAKFVEKAGKLIISVYVPVTSGRNTIQLGSEQTKLLRDALSAHPNAVVLSHGSPYLISSFPQIRVYAANYGASRVLEAALASAIFGETPITGTLPVSIPGTAFKAGDGLQIESFSGSRDSEYLHGVHDVLSADDACMDSIENRFSGVDSIVDKGIKEKAYPGAVLLVGRTNGIVYQKAYGRFTYENTSKPVQPNTIFDLASVTKVVATTTATMMCLDRKLFQLDDKVAEYIPDFGARGKDKVTIRNLLLHNSGLRAFDAYYKKYTMPEQVLAAIYDDSLVYTTGTKTTYSDLGIITLGKLIERVTGRGLDVFCNEEIFVPLGMDSTFFNPPVAFRQLIMPTEYDDYWRNRQLQGEVHDEAASLLGGVAGHAGLFSTAEDIAQLLLLLLNKGVVNEQCLIREETISDFTTRQNQESTRGLGWDTKSETKSSAGSKFSMQSFGHTGYTGTSVWVDKNNGVFVVFLTNRVFPTRNNLKLSDIRPVLHDAVMKAIF